MALKRPLNHSRACSLPTHRCRGLSLGGTLLILASIIGVGTTTYLATPYVLKAGDSPSDNSNFIDRSDWPDDARAAVDALDTIIRTSKHTLLLKTTNNSPRPTLEFIVLWLNDEKDPGHLNPSEIVILRHSSLLQSITAYAATKEAFEDDQKTTPARLTYQLRQPGFIDKFLSQSTVESHVIGIRIAHWQIHPNHSSDSAAQSLPHSSPGQIELTCLRQSDDTSLTASVPTPLRPTYQSR